MAQVIQDYTALGSGISCGVHALYDLGVFNRELKNLNPERGLAQFIKTRHHPYSHIIKTAKEISNSKHFPNRFVAPILSSLMSSLGVHSTEINQTPPLTVGLISPG